MERLTKWEDGSITYNEKREFECGEFCDSCSHGAGNCKTIENMIKKLATYEVLEEQGLLVRLPCRVGDTVWVVTSPINVFDECDGAAEYEVYESFLSSVTYYTCGEQFRINAKVTNSFIVEYFRECDFGKTVFLTREEADSKLEELKNEI